MQKLLLPCAVSNLPGQIRPQVPCLQQEGVSPKGSSGEHPPFPSSAAYLLALAAISEECALR